jgi:uncharacterized membrane protein
MKRHRQSRASRERGQSLIIGAFAIIALIGMVGLAVDVGLVYVERIRVRRAADAAALAAAADLPLEQAAHVRALEYLEENSYPCGLTFGDQQRGVGYAGDHLDADDRGRRVVGGRRWPIILAANGPGTTV